MTPFDLGICCFTGVFLVVASVMLFFSYRRSREEGPIAVTIQDAFLVIYGALLQQGTPPEEVKGTPLGGTESAT